MPQPPLADVPTDSDQARPIVVCADDYGMNEAVSRAIVSLAREARLSATSAMVLSPLWPQHAAWLQDCRGQLDVGLHLDWTSPFAVAQGHGMPLGRLMLRALLRQLSSEQVRGAIERQLDLFERHWQAPPDHVDGHQHVQQFPVVREQLVQVLAKRYPQTGPRPWLRVSQPLSPGGDAKAWVIGAMGAKALAGLAQRAGLAHSAWLTGIDDFNADRAVYQQRLVRWLTQASRARAVVLMCHPGDGVADASDAIAAARVREYEVLRSADWPRALQAQGCRLARGQLVLA